MRYVVSGALRMRIWMTCPVARDIASSFLEQASRADASKAREVAPTLALFRTLVELMVKVADGGPGGSLPVPDDVSDPMALLN